MAVLMLGFTEVAELDAVMQKLIAESGHYLFYTLCGGTGGDSRTESVAEVWAHRNGCPIKYIMDSDFENLKKKLLKECDYLVIKITDQTPQWQKNFMMQIKAQGKHGTVIK